VYEHNHVVTGNYVQDSQDYAYVLGAGDAYTYPSFSHAPAMNTRMDDNIAVNVTVRGAIIGHGGSGAVPEDCSFSNNTILGSISNLIVVSKRGNTVMEGNRTTGDKPAMPRPPLTISDVGPGSYTYGIPVVDGTYELTAKHSGLAMVVQGASPSNGALVIQYAFGGAANNDLWKISRLADGYFKMINDQSLLSIDVAGSSTAEGVNIEQWTYHGGSNQQVSFEGMGDGSYRIKMRHSGLCLNVSGASTANGASIIQYPCGGGNNERWILTRSN
jgi:Ricin-type beta-trefoil lectin domain-like